MTILDILNLTKRYGDAETLHNVSLRVDAGECVALLGHNGAGKTTMMRMVLGLSAISGGQVQVAGEAPGSAVARAITGFLPENVAFHGALSGREQLHHFARLKSVPLAVADEMAERVGIAHAIDRKIRTYSKGMRQRIGLAQALLGTPKLVLLDEPTSGLDPVSRFEFYALVRELCDKGSAVLISSHALTEMETRTDRIAILSNGHLVANDPLAQLRKESALPMVVEVETVTDGAAVLAERLGQGDMVAANQLHLNCVEAQKMELIRRVMSQHDLVVDLVLKPAGLEDLYRDISACNVALMQEAD